MRRGGKKEARREMSAVTEEESWKREMPRCRDVAVPNTGAARTGLKRGEHDKLPSLMPISAILLYEQRSEGT